MLLYLKQIAIYYKSTWSWNTRIHENAIEQFTAIFVSFLTGIHDHRRHAFITFMISFLLTHNCACYDYFDNWLIEIALIHGTPYLFFFVEKGTK